MEIKRKLCTHGEVSRGAFKEDATILETKRKRKDAYQSRNPAFSRYGTLRRWAERTRDRGPNRREPRSNKIVKIQEAGQISRSIWESGCGTNVTRSDRFGSMVITSTSPRFRSDKSTALLTLNLLEEPPLLRALLRFLKGNALGKFSINIGKCGTRCYPKTAGMHMFPAAFRL